MKSVALITGATGQDGSYLAELLLENDYDVWCLIPRRSSYDIGDPSTLGNLRFLNPDHRQQLKLLWGDVTDRTSIENAIRISRPHEVYNLAAQSHVHISYETPHLTTEVNAIGVLNLLESLRQYSPSTKFYQASTSEMFGNSAKMVMLDGDGIIYQNEATPFAPASPYAMAKVYAHYASQLYRRAHKMFTTAGILFNHESPRRGHNFVTSKVIRTALAIVRQETNELRLGNIHSYRDWGHAADYVRAMHMMMNADEPDDYVIATGESRSVADLCEYVFKAVGLDDYRNYLVVDQSLFRNEDVINLRGDATKARNKLGWAPQYTFYQLIDEMIAYHEKHFNGEVLYEINNDNRRRRSSWFPSGRVVTSTY